MYGIRPCRWQGLLEKEMLPGTGVGPELRRLRVECSSLTQLSWVTYLSSEWLNPGKF